MKIVFNDYLNDKIKLDFSSKLALICLIIVLSGTFGWIYEFIFYYFNGGCTEFYMQGGNFLPWINIYATGALLILFLSYKYKKKPFIVFLIGFISAGVLEYITGYVLYHFCDGLRLWDYNKEILNFGNIDGFICLRSVLFFGVSALILMYFMIPFCIYLYKKIGKKMFMYISFSLCFIFLFDEFYNLIFSRLLNLPKAPDVSQSIGFKYVTFQ